MPSFGESLDLALDRFWFVTRETVKLPAYILDPERRDEITGVVGSYEITRQTILDDIADTVGILALISLSLAIINLFRSCRSTAGTSSGLWWRRYGGSRCPTPRWSALESWVSCS